MWHQSITLGTSQEAEMRKSATVQKVPFLSPDVITKVIPAPTDGWDAISPLAEMDPKRAAILVNFVPRPGFVELRGGYLPFSTTGSMPVESLMVWRGPTNEKFYAAMDGHIYDITSGTASSVVAGLGNDRWQYINFTSGGGVHVIQTVNGTDPLQQYDGSSWTTPSITGLPGGVTTNNFINIYAQKQRLWYFPANSTLAIFMPVGAITGPISGFQDFGTIWTKGGHIIGMADWTIDGGSGPQDYAMFISSRGQVALYAGTDPANANAWSLVGVFDIAPPIGVRCLTRVGSDVAVITQQGVIPISQALPFDPSADRSVAITARIQNAMSAAANLYQQNFGWEFITYPNQQLALLNIPQSPNIQQVQFVMNTLTGAWCSFSGWNANTFALFQDNLYFGDNNGNINQAYISLGDNMNPIAADMQCAFNWLDEPGKVKRMTMIQPLLTIGQTTTPTLAIDTDFEVSTAVATVSEIIGGSLWNIDLWDSALWAGGNRNYISWLSVDALGHAMAVRLRVTINGNVPSVNDILPIFQVNAFNSISELGGAI
jgi:hypothetical protein